MVNPIKQTQVRPGFNAYRKDTENNTLQGQHAITPDKLPQSPSKFPKRSSLLSAWFASILHPKTLTTPTKKTLIKFSDPNCTKAACDPTNPPHLSKEPPGETQDDGKTPEEDSDVEKESSIDAHTYTQSRSAKNSHSQRLTDEGEPSAANPPISNPKQQKHTTEIFAGQTKETSSAQNKSQETPANQSCAGIDLLDAHLKTGTTNQQSQDQKECTDVEMHGDSPEAPEKPRQMASDQSSTSD